jgi:hypothetical protein
MESCTNLLIAYMFSAHCLFGMTLPNDSAGESRNGNGFFQDGGRTKKKLKNIHPHGPILILEWQEQQKQLERAEAEKCFFSKMAARLEKIKQQPSPWSDTST